MSEKVKSKIFEIFAPETLYFETKLEALGDVVLKIWGVLALMGAIFKNGAYEYRRRSKVEYLKSLPPNLYIDTKITSLGDVVKIWANWF